MKRQTPALLAIWAGLTAASVAYAADPLPSWNDGTAKQSILQFITRVTQEGGPEFVAPAERITVFDNDGTLWAEQPMYFQFLFMRPWSQRVYGVPPEQVIGNLEFLWQS